MQPIGKQVILVTGSTDGIGKITALKLAHQGAKVLIHGRSQENAYRILQEIQFGGYYGQTKRKNRFYHRSRHMRRRDGTCRHSISQQPGAAATTKMQLRA